MRPAPAYFIACHIGDDYGPQFALRNHLVKRRASFVFVTCPFDFARVPAAQLERYEQGQCVETVVGHANRSKGVVSWVKDVLFVLAAGWRWCGRQTQFIGINNLHASVGVLLRWLKRCQSVVYYIVDYTPRRFPSRVLNLVYQRLARFAGRHADCLWAVSERIKRVYTAWGAAEQATLVVPIGLDPEDISVAEPGQVERNTLVVVSTLFENKGVQLAIEALPALPGARLKIIGVGPYADALRGLARSQGVEDRVAFLGHLDRKALFAVVARSRIALATYVADAANYSYYADSAKPKEYLACGVPTVITRVPWIAELIAEKPMGLAIEYRVEELVAACRRLFEDDALWRTCRENALRFSQGQTWEAIYDAALSRTGAGRGRTA